MSGSKKSISFLKPFAHLAFVLPAMIFLASLFTCTKDEPRLMKVLNDSIAEISVATVKVYFTVVDVGEGIDQYGQCWSKENQDPTLESCDDSLSGPSIMKTGLKVQTIANLNPGSRYYIRTYLKKGSLVVYSNALECNTQVPTPPTVITGDAENIGMHLIRISGNIKSKGHTATGITDHGHCWSAINPMPTLADSLKPMGPKEDTGYFSSTILNLSANTLYYIRAYATNEAGTEFGSPRTVTTAITDLPLVSTKEVSGVGTNRCTCGGVVSMEGGSPVTVRGVCWSTSPDPVVTDNSTGDGSGPGSFTSLVTGLLPNTTYHIRAYAANTYGTGYGDDIPFDTPEAFAVPAVITAGISELAATSATSGGTITSDGGQSITVKGVCWGTSIAPTTDDEHSQDGSGPDAFVSYMTGLSSGQQYYVRAYAENSVGTGYGQSISFKTTTKPSVVTTSVSFIAPTSAVCGGTVTDDGGATVTARGVCWSREINPAVSNFTTTDGEGEGAFVSTLTGLEQLTTYYVRAYATNVNGTSYGEQVNFTTTFECGTQLSDLRDGKTYSTVLIGNQCWMQQNLNVGTRIDGTTAQTNNSTIEKYCYDDLETNCNTYGGLYRWDEMMQYTTKESTQGVCPAGFHLPSDHEWKVLEMALGMTPSEADQVDWRGTDEGGKLKALGYTYWNSPNTGATNSSLFSALPAGGSDNTGAFCCMGSFADYWTSTWIVDTQSHYRFLSYDSQQIRRIDGDRAYGTAVRCVR